MSQIHQDIVRKLHEGKKYLVLLQGPRGSGKTFFAQELAKIFPEYQICSIDEFCTQGQNRNDAYSSCKQQIKSYLRAGVSVIYNDRNLRDDYIKDLIQEAKNLKITVIIFRFFPDWSETDSAELAKIHHPTTEQSCCSDSIISDNKIMFEFNNDLKLPHFGIRCIRISNETTQTIAFTSCPPNLDAKKRMYIEKGLWKEPIVIPKAPKIPFKLRQKRPTQDTLQSENMQQVPHHIKMELEKKDRLIKILIEQNKQLKEQLEELIHPSSMKDGSLRRGRRATNDDDDDDVHVREDNNRFTEKQFVEIPTLHQHGPRMPPPPWMQQGKTHTFANRSAASSGGNGN